MIDHDLPANVYTVCASLMAEMKNEIEEQLVFFYPDQRSEGTGTVDEPVEVFLNFFENISFSHSSPINVVQMFSCISLSETHLKLR